MINSFVSVDLETANRSRKSSTSAIIQVGACKVIDGKKVAEFNELVHTWQIIPDIVVQLTGITNAKLHGARKSKEVLADFLDFLGKLPLVAQNAKFDIPIIYNKVKSQLMVEMVNDYFCTMTLARMAGLPVPNHRLNTLAKYYGIPNLKHHDAINDARVCGDIFLRLQGYPAVCVEPEESSISTVLGIMGFKPRER